MSLTSFPGLSDKGLLKLYAEAKTSVLFANLFSRVEVPQEMYDLIKQINTEISYRGLDRKD